MILKILTFPYRKSKQIKDYGGFKTFMKESCKVVRNYILQKRFGFHDWHLRQLIKKVNIQYILVNQRNQDFKDFVGKGYKIYKSKQFDECNLLVFKKI